MSGDRLERIERLVAVRQRQLDIVRDKLAEAQRELARASQEASDAEAAWHRRACEAAPAAATISEMMAERAYLETLRNRAEQSRHELKEATSRHCARREAVCTAHRELRRLELWSEQVAETLRQEAGRKERMREDELAARVSQGMSQ